MCLFIKCLIENPSFDSQTKENMTSRPSSFGSKCELSEDVYKKVFKSDIIENLLTFAKFKQTNELKKTDGGKQRRILGELLNSVIDSVLCIDSFPEQRRTTRKHLSPDGIVWSMDFGINCRHTKVG